MRRSHFAMSIRTFFGSSPSPSSRKRASDSKEDSDAQAVKRTDIDDGSSSSSSTIPTATFGNDHAETTQLRRDLDLKVQGLTVADSKTAEGKAQILLLSHAGDPGWINKELNILRTRAFKSASSKVCVVHRMPPEKAAITWTFVVQDDALPFNSPLCICDLCFIEV